MNQELIMKKKQLNFSHDVFNDHQCTYVEIRCIKIRRDLVIHEN